MCTAVFAWQAHPFYPFLLFFSRDEYQNRPTKPVEWWEGGEILGGRDEVAGGTWLACTRGGKVAILTNVLELHTLPEAKSRGELPVRFLERPREFAEEVVKEAHLYNGFNLIMADLPYNTMVYISNMPKGEPIDIQDVPPGTHVLSNAKLGSQLLQFHSFSFQAQHLVLSFGEMLEVYHSSEIPLNKVVGKLMRDTVKSHERTLPSICSPDWELSLSSILVEAGTPQGRYGTRSTAVLTVSAGGEVSFHQIYLQRGEWREQTIKYQIEKPSEMRDNMP
ncbi:uncharacterized protein LOC130758618 isoform X2 [Actinidia eriantha]|uniref:uncharacterized protein LOC130758618 isoform X2 n=1 Tax=Actinidia eriantha TaxID=165200 RepID=UPI00258CC415|nr:uncharacterized protein LOC130758618 isoform X2 [Actinidia eriantha]